MPSIYVLKPAFQNRLRPMVRRLAACGVTPNQVTVAALLLSLGVGAALLALPGHPWPLLMLPAALFLRMALNAIDGMLAREHAMTSPLGALLNELGDGLSDAALYLPLAYVPGVAPEPVVLLVVLALMGELAGVAAVPAGASRRYEGPLGKSDRAFLFGALGLLLGLGVVAGAWVSAVLWLALPLAALTVINRMRGALRESAARACREEA